MPRRKEPKARAVAEALHSAEQQMRDQPDVTTTTLRGQETAYQEVVQLQGELGRAQAERDNITLKIVDSDRSSVAFSTSCKRCGTLPPWRVSWVMFDTANALPAMPRPKKWDTSMRVIYANHPMMMVMNADELPL
jgi:hypothetical protein